MEIAIPEPLENFVKQAIREGRYASESEVVSLGLRLVEEHDRKLADLRAMLGASIEAGGLVTPEEMDAALEEQEAGLIALGYPE